MADTHPNAEILGLTAQIVSAHVSHNPVPATELPGLIQEVFRTLSGVGSSPAPEPE